MMWCVFLPLRVRMCSVNIAAVANARQNSSASCGSNPGRADQVAVVEGEVDVVDEERPARQVERDLHERFVERHLIGREPAHAGLVAERLLHRFAERDADVLDRVVGVDLEIALALDGQVHAAVLARAG